MIWHWYKSDEALQGVPENTIAVLYDAKGNTMQMAELIGGYWYSWPASKCYCGANSCQSIHEMYQFWTTCPPKPE